MTSTRTTVFAALLALLAGAPAATAQGPLQERIHYSINTPHALRMGD
jgi:hypothetical protein